MVLFLILLLLFHQCLVFFCEIPRVVRRSQAASHGTTKRVSGQYETYFPVCARLCVVCVSGVCVVCVRTRAQVLSREYVHECIILSLFPLVFSLLSCYLYLTVTVDLFSGSSTKSPPVACIILVWQHSSKGSTQSNHKPDLKTYQISTSWAGQCLFLCLFLFVEKPSSALYSHHKYCIHC